MLFAEENVIRLEKSDTRMVRWVCNVRPEDWISTEELKTRLKLKSMRKCLRLTTESPEEDQVKQGSQESQQRHS